MTEQTYSPRERVLTTLAGREPDRVPLDTWMSKEAIVKICEYLGLPTETDPYGMWHEGILQRLHVDFRRPYTPYVGPPLRTFADGSWETEYGVVRKGYGYGVAVTHPLADATEVDEILAYGSYPDPDWYDYSGLGDYCRRHAEYAFTGGSKFPFFTEACDLMGMEQVMLNLYEAPQLVEALFHKLVDVHITLTERWLEVAPESIDILICTDDYGGRENLLISPGHWRTFMKPALQRVVDFGQERGLHVMLHSDGAIRAIIPDLIEMGVDILNPIEPEADGMEPASIKRDFGDQLVLHGAASAMNLVHGTPEEVAAEARYLFEHLAPGGGFVLCPSNHLLEDMPVENILALYDTAYEAGQY
jgi:uroporphyrinogen decarboxylase